MKYKFKDKELKILLKNMVIICDTREQVNQHILLYFDKKKIKYKVEKLEYGDYSVCIESNEETVPIGVKKDWYFTDNIAIERKNSVDELVQSIKDRDRFEKEFLKFSHYGAKVVMMVEDVDGYNKAARGDYRSQYSKEAFIGSIETFTARYNLNIQFVDKVSMGFRIYKMAYYHIYEKLKNEGYIEQPS
ncbi:ERCC4 domain-containing protein [Clostridium sp. DL1XJH146]